MWNARSLLRCDNCDNNCRDRVGGHSSQPYNVFISFARLDPHPYPRHFKDVLHNFMCPREINQGPKLGKRNVKTERKCGEIYW